MLCSQFFFLLFLSSLFHTHSKTKGHILYSLEQTGSMEYTPCTYEFTDRRVHLYTIAYYSDTCIIHFVVDFIKEWSFMK